MNFSISKARRKRAQVSLEYLLLFAASVSLLVLFATTTAGAAQLANRAIEQHTLRNSFDSITTAVNSLAFLSPGSTTAVSIYLFAPARLATLTNGKLELTSVNASNDFHQFNSTAKTLIPIDLINSKLLLPAGFSKLQATRMQESVQLSLYQTDTTRGSN